jgi:hypothetical protein
MAREDITSEVKQNRTYRRERFTPATETRSHGEDEIESGLRGKGEVVLITATQEKNSSVSSVPPWWIFPFGFKAKEKAARQLRRPFLQGRIVPTEARP